MAAAWAGDANTVFCGVVVFWAWITGGFGVWLLVLVLVLVSSGAGEPEFAGDLRWPCRLAGEVWEGQVELKGPVIQG